MNKLNWNYLLCPKRLGDLTSSGDHTGGTRTHFQRDYDRIIFSSPFRRLQNKTQVFPLPGSVFVHNRLTHSLEVASVGRSLGNNLSQYLSTIDTGCSSTLLAEIPTIVSTACLAHDMGNPPFGHSGEEAIRNYFISNASTFEPLVTPSEWKDLTRYEGNANTFRLLSHQLKGRRSGGFRLSLATLGALVKYPYPSDTEDRKKFGFFREELPVYNQIAIELGLIEKAECTSTFPRHPLVYLVEAADDICYQIMDIEDAHKLGILSHRAVKSLLLAFFQTDPVAALDNIDHTLSEVTDLNEQIAYLRAMVIGKLVDACSKVFIHQYGAIINGVESPALVQGLDEHLLRAFNGIKTTAIEQVYAHRSVIEIELAGYRILETLLDCYCKSAVGNDNYSDKVNRLVPAEFRCTEGTAYQKIMSVLDFVSGMTDLYALEQFRVIQGISLPGSRY